MILGPNSPRPRVAAFTNAASAEAWDAWFRWRDGDDPRDLTIEQTWERVARALAERGGGPERAEAYRRAFSEWRLLPDAGVIRHAGTGRNDWRLPAPTATLNLAAFVQNPVSAHASVDDALLAETTRLARCLVDDISVPGVPRRGAVALIGFGDAIAMLGLRYDSDEGRTAAAAMARTVAEAARASRRSGDGSETLAVVLGLQSRLALLANATSDGADPIEEEYVVRWPDRGGDRRTRALGPALTLRRERALAGATLPKVETARELGPAARPALVRAIAPWVDADPAPQPVDSPAGAARGAENAGSVA